MTDLQKAQLQLSTHLSKLLARVGDRELSDEISESIANLIDICSKRYMEILKESAAEAEAEFAKAK